MYGKIFESIYDGTLAEDWRALITFQQMIVLCDSDGVLDMTTQAVSRRTGIPIEHINAGVEILEQPDPHSRTSDDQGRRIMRLDDHRAWGWKIINHQKYRDLVDHETVKEQNRVRQQRYRDKHKGVIKNNVTSHTVTENNAPSRHTNTDANTNIKKLAHKFDKFWDAYPKKKSKGAAEKVWRAIKPSDQLLKTMLEAIERGKQSDSWEQDRGQFIPYPAKWLNSKGWEDDYLVTTAKKGRSL